MYGKHFNTLDDTIYEDLEPFFRMSSKEFKERYDFAFNVDKKFEIFEIKIDDHSMVDGGRGLKGHSVCCLWLC